MVWGLPKLASGKVYKVWVAHGSQQQPLQVFDEAMKTEAIQIVPPQPIDQYQQIMITVEDDPNAQQPSANAVLLGGL